jgi:hypothetical protein
VLRPRRLYNLALSALRRRPDPLSGPLGDALRARGGEATADHSAWNSLVDAHVHEGRVDYDGVTADREVLDGYLQQLASLDLSALSQDHRLAALINAYNAFTIDLICRQPRRPGSILDIPSPWTGPTWTLAGHAICLDEIEHTLIRPGFRDPRVHFALNCASVGCPTLRGGFDGDTLDHALDLATRATIQNPDYVRFEQGRLHLTRIFQIYATDFTDAASTPRADDLVAWCIPYMTGSTKESLGVRSDRVPTAWLPYDWSLNQR